MSGLTRWIAGASLVAAASCQLVSGVGDYSFVTDGATGGAGGAGTGGEAPGGGGSSAGVNIPWAFQLTTTGQVVPTALRPAGEASAIFMGYYSQILQFEQRIGGSYLSSTSSADQSLDGFLFVATGADAPPAPFEIEGLQGAQVRPQAVVPGNGTTEDYIIAGTADVGLAGGNVDFSALFVGGWQATGELAWLDGWTLGDNATVTALDITDDDASLFVAGYASGPLGLHDPVGHGTPDDVDGFAALASLATLRAGGDTPITWSRAFRGVGIQAVRGAKRRGDGWLLYGDYQATMTFEDEGVGSDDLDSNGGDGSLFLVTLDQAGDRTGDNRFLANTTGRSEAVTIADGPEGRLLLGGHFEGTVSTPKGTLTNAGDRDLFVIELISDLSVRGAISFGEIGGLHEMAGADYVDVGGATVAAFAASCVRSLAFGGELFEGNGNSADLCLGVLAANDGDPRGFDEISLARLGDEGAQTPADQRPTFLVTRGSEIIVGGDFRGTLLAPEIYTNGKDNADGFIFALDAAED